MTRPLLPLAKLGPLTALGVVAAAAAVLVFRYSDYPPACAGIGLIPLLLYLGWSHYKARKMLLAEHGREREIIRAGFVANSADRTALFWGGLFGLVSSSATVAALLVWGYQGVIWYKKGAWTSITWLSVGGPVPGVDLELAQRGFTWLANTNLGVVFLVSGLLLAAPLVALHSKASYRAKLERKRLINLKKRS